MEARSGIKAAASRRNTKTVVRERLGEDIDIDEILALFRFDLEDTLIII